MPCMQEGLHRGESRVGRVLEHKLYGILPVQSQGLLMGLCTRAYDQEAGQRASLVVNKNFFTAVSEGSRDESSRIAYQRSISSIVGLNITVAPLKLSGGLLYDRLARLCGTLFPILHARRICTHHDVCRLGLFQTQLKHNVIA